MNEIQRQQYLEAVGIDSYMPRWVLPMAATSPPCMPVLPSTAAPGGPPSPVVPAAAPTSVVPAQPQAVASTAANSVGAAATPASNAPVPEPSLPSGGASSVLAAMAPASENVPQKVRSLAEKVAATQALSIPAPRFALSVWRISDDLMVVDSRHSELALPTEPLLVNILNALGYSATQLGRAEVLRWPMFENRHAPQGEAEARETLLAVLEGMIEAAPVRYLLLMGAQACHYLLAADQLPDKASEDDSMAAAEGKTFSLESLNCTAIAVPGLSDMLRQPQLKAATWQAIQPLRLR